MIHNILAFLWLAIIGFGIIMYVILDGFDLGVGIMSVFFPNEHHRDLMVSTILPVWDGNETWLVFGGATLYGAFPLAFSTLLPLLYIPILVMVMALLFRGVVFEFRLKAHRSKRFWEVMFFLGSITGTFIQGVMLGAFVKGFHTLSVGGVVPSFSWLSPFSIATGVAMIFGYVLLGANWLIAKTVGDLQKRAYDIAKICLILVVLFALIISLWSPFIDPRIYARWFNPRLMGYLAILPLLTALAVIAHWIALQRRAEYSPFWLSIAIFLLCYVGFIVSVWPYIVPRSITFWAAAAPADSLGFMLVGAVIMLPILLYYTYHSYKIFSGKVTDVIAY